jgi:alpha-tubulin suppressor-like RCC1 family protein
MLLPQTHPPPFPCTPPQRGLEEDTITQVSVGYFHVLARSSSGKAYGWGGNTYYMVGDYTTSNRYSAVEASAINDLVQYLVASVSAGYYTSCIATKDGAAKCWGYGYHGALGTGTNTAASATVYTIDGYDGTTLPSPAPSPVPTPTPTTNRTRHTKGVVYAGTHTIHVVDDDGGVWYAGWRGEGRLGNGAGVASSQWTLTRMAGVNDVVKVRFLAIPSTPHTTSATRDPSHIGHSPQTTSFAVRSQEHASHPHSLYPLSSTSG